jgi:RNA polymerase sigma factor (sigma-70 family)
MYRLDDDPADDDRSLVARVAAGEICALEMLYVRRWDSVRRYCRLLVWDEGLVEELSQDVLLAVWQGACRYAGTGSVRAWLLTIAKYQAHNLLRRREVPMDEDPPSEEIPASEPGPEDEVIGAARCEEIARAIRSLSPIHREILALTVDQQLSYREIAEVLAISIGTVKSRLYLARKALTAGLNGRESAS